MNEDAELLAQLLARELPANHFDLRESDNPEPGSLTVELSSPTRGERKLFVRQIGNTVEVAYSSGKQTDAGPAEMQFVFNRGEQLEAFESVVNFVKQVVNEEIVVVREKFLLRRQTLLGFVARSDKPTKKRRVLGYESWVGTYDRQFRPESRTVVTFRCSRFNTSEPRNYFINDCCFGDDVAKWLIEQLSRAGYQCDESAGQEDFGWYLTFRVSEIRHCFVIGYRPGAPDELGDWIGSLERTGFWRSWLGGRQRGILPEAVGAINQILINEKAVHDVTWHFKHDFDAGREERGLPAARN